MSSETQPNRDDVFPLPWRYEHGYIWSADGSVVAEMRGWGHLTGTGGGRALPEAEAAEIQDRIGAELAAAWNRRAQSPPAREPEHCDQCGGQTIREGCPLCHTPRVDRLARAIWALHVEDCTDRDGQEGMPAYSTYADGKQEPCALDEQSDDLQAWARWRASALLEHLTVELMAAAPQDTREAPASTGEAEHG